MDKKIADELLAKTRENYDNFAESFSETRNYLWPEIKSLVSVYFKTGDKVLDIGCGNGRFAQIINEGGAQYFGIDNSRNLIAIAQNKFAEANFAVGDALALPFKENTFDLAMAIAVLHHIPSKDNQRLFLKEARRVLKPGGILIITVWDLRPLSMARAKQWKRFKSFLKSQTKIVFGLEKLDFGDFFIPWQNEYQRYVHAFSIGGLIKLLKDSGFKIEKSGVTTFGSRESNLYFVAKKRQN